MSRKAQSPKAKKVVKLRRVSTLKQLGNTSFDLDSNLTQEAVRNLGYVPDDFVVKKKEDFRETKADPDDIVELRYNHYKNKTMKMVNQVLKEQERMKYAPGGNSVLKTSRNKTVINLMPSCTIKRKEASPDARFKSMSAKSLEKDSPSKSTQYKKIEIVLKKEEEIAKKALEREQKQNKKFEKLQKALKKMQKEKEYKKLQKEQKVQERLREIYKTQQRKTEEIEKHLKNKNLKASQIIQKNREEMNQKLQDQDLNYAEKQEKALEHIKSMEEVEFRRARERLELIEDKQKKSEKLHDTLMNRRISEIRSKNEQSMSKLQRYKQYQEDEYTKKCASVLQKEEKDLKRLEKINKYKKKLAKSLQKSCMESTLKAQGNKDNQEYEMERKKAALMKRFKKNEQRVSQLKEEHEKELIRKHEMFKLKQQEIENERERLRRLENMKKMQVLEKHQNIDHTLNESKQYMSFLEKVKTERNMKTIRDKDEMVRSLEQSFIWNK